MQNTTSVTHTMTPQNIMPLGRDSCISVDSFKVILEMFSEALTQINKAESWRPGDTQLVNARNIILSFYDYQDSHIPSIAIEMFNDRLVGNLRNDDSGQMTHSQYQPEPLVRYASEVIDWGLVAGLVAAPKDLTYH